MTAALTTSVVVPAFGRPELLDRCLEALRRQRLPPDEVLVAARPADEETLRVVERACATKTNTVRRIAVTAPGHLPPLAAAVSAASSVVVAFVDDDAEPWPSWLEALVRHYADPAVGGVGGLVAQPGPDERLVAARIARLDGGRFDAVHLERVPEQWGARAADVLRGTNMSFRRSLLLDYPWDDRLNRGAATDFEVDLCAWIRRRGYRLVYDPDAAVTHHLGPRPELGRSATPERIADYSHNLVYVSGKALSRPRAALAVASAFLVGSRASHGMATALADTLAGRPPSLGREVLPALRGKLDGLRSLREYRRDGPRPLPEPPE